MHFYSVNYFLIKFSTIWNFKLILKFGTSNLEVLKQNKNHWWLVITDYDKFKSQQVDIIWISLSIGKCVYALDITIGIQLESDGFRNKRLKDEDKNLSTTKKLLNACIILSTLEDVIDADCD